MAPPACEDVGKAVDSNKVLLAAVLETQDAFNRALQCLMSGEPHLQQERRAFMDVVSHLTGRPQLSADDNGHCVRSVDFHELYAALCGSGLSPDVQEMPPKMLALMGQAMRRTIEEQQEDKEGRGLPSDPMDLPEASTLLNELRLFNDLVDQLPTQLEWPLDWIEQTDMLLDLERAIENGTCSFAEQLPNLAEFAQEVIGVELAKSYKASY